MTSPFSRSSSVRTDTCPRSPNENHFSRCEDGRAGVSLPFREKGACWSSALASGAPGRGRLMWALALLARSVSVVWVPPAPCSPLSRPRFACKISRRIFHWISIRSRADEPIPTKNGSAARSCRTFAHQIAISSRIGLASAHGHGLMSSCRMQQENANNGGPR